MTIRAYLVKPHLAILKRRFQRHIKHQNDPIGISIERSGDAFKTLLPGSIPDLENNFLLIHPH
jgi:hypothetical protein